jgi:hypothetical protein
MLPVRIASILPSEGSQNKLIVPETPLEPPDLERPSRAAARRSLLEALGFLVAALAAVAWVAFGAVRSRRAALAAAERKDEVLAAKLRSLLAAGPDKAHWLFVEEATALFRQFLRERYGDGRGPFGWKRRDLLRVDPGIPSLRDCSRGAGPPAGSRQGGGVGTGSLPGPRWLSGENEKTRPGVGSRVRSEGRSPRCLRKAWRFSTLGRFCSSC